MERIKIRERIILTVTVVAVRKCAVGGVGGLRYIPYEMNSPLSLKPRQRKLLAYIWFDSAYFTDCSRRQLTN